MGRYVATNGIVVRETLKDASQPLRGDLYRLEIEPNGASGRPELHAIVGGEHCASVLTIEFTADELRRLADIMVTTELRELRKIAEGKEASAVRIPKTRPH